MSKHVLIITTSMRRFSKSTALAEAFQQGALEAGNQVEIISLSDKQINFCQGCLACQKTMKCILHDDMEMIIEKMKVSDVIVFATPIYFYEMSGQMKTLLDRSNPLYPSSYSFRDIYLLISAAENEEHAADGAIKGLSGWIECFEHASLQGVIKALAADDFDDMRQHPAYAESYQMGMRI